MKYNNSRPVIFMPIIIAVAVIAGIFIGNKLQRHPSDVFIYPSLDKVNAVLDYIMEEYVDSVSKEDLIEMTIPKVLENLDPHSIYIPAVDFQAMNEPLEGNFFGIGVQFNIMYDTVVVINTIPGGPSEKLGIMAGDRIVKINDSIVAGVHINNMDVMKMLKGPEGTIVNIDVKRNGVDELLNYDIERGIIPLESVDVAYMVNNDVGYIKITKFAKTTYQEFRDAVKKLKPLGLKKIIIDLRGNSGGYMDAATNIVDEFLEKGKLIVYTQGRSRPKSSTFSTERGLCKNDDIIVLIDEWSASASEIFAGAIQDNDRGFIIGRRSYGKALVQEPTIFSDGSSIRLTIARYYTPTGRCIQKSYKNGLDEYNSDLEERYIHGEFEQKDSIRFNDSLKYTTPKGRTVYGGGGIMPDIFVGVDTSGISAYFSHVSNKGLVYRFAFDFTDKHRKDIENYTDYREIERYLDKQNILEKFIQFAKDQGVEPDAKDIKTSKDIITIQLKAYIARNIIDNDGFYPIISKLDNTLQKAIEKFDKE